jgi:ABC-type nitrate/sulfonate/bicarbonate transport system substrate-binding protein
MLTSFKIYWFVLCSIVAVAVSSRAQGQSTAPLEKIVVSYPSKSITSFPILETAQRKGFFQREGLNVSAVYMRGGIDIKALLTGDADFGTGGTTAVTAFVAGAPLRVVMSLNSYVDQGLYSQPKYRNLAQLKGQSIGSLNPGGLVDTLLRKVLAQGGLSPERDVIILNMGGTPERYAALKAGTLAASMLSAPHSLRAEKEGFTKLAATRDYVDVPGTALVVHADKIKKQTNMIKRFMRASLRAMAYIRDNRADTTQLIVREFGMDQEIAGLAYKLLLDLLAIDGKIRVEGYQLLVDFARAAQKIDRPINAAQLVDETLLEELLREGIVTR